MFSLKFWFLYPQNPRKKLKQGSNPFVDSYKMSRETCFKPLRPYLFKSNDL